MSLRASVTERREEIRLQALGALRQIVTGASAASHRGPGSADDVAARIVAAGGVPILVDQLLAGESPSHASKRRRAQSYLHSLLRGAEWCRGRPLADWATKLHKFSPTLCPLQWRRTTERIRARIWDGRVHMARMLLAANAWGTDRRVTGADRTIAAARRRETANAWAAACRPPPPPATTVPTPSRSCPPKKYAWSIK